MTTDKQIEVIEGNKLIAEFMGARKRYFLFHRGESSSRQVSDEIFDGVSFHAETYFSSGRVKDKYIRWQYHKWQMSPTDAYGQFDNWLKYHTSWDWLMPVVEKIEAIHDDFHGYFGVHISSNSCSIQGTRLNTTPENYHPAYFADWVLDTKLQATWYAVVQFIQWYNQHSKPQTI